MNTMRISGIASGLDTESIVAQLISADSARLNKMLRQEQTYQWRQEAYTSVNKNMANFILNSRKSFGLTQISTFGTVRQSSLDSLDWVKKASSSNESIVEAKARADAMSGTHTVEVERLASVASLTSLDISDTMLDANSKFKEAGTITISTAKGTADIEVTAGMTIQTFISKINSAKDGETSLGIRASYDADLGKLMMTTKEAGENQFIAIEQSANMEIWNEDDEINMLTLDQAEIDANPILTVIIDGEETQLDTTSYTQEDMITALNVLGLDAKYEGSMLVINSDKEVSIENEGGVALGAPLTSQSVFKTGQDALIRFNGEEVEKTSNTFTIFGVEMNIKAAQPGEVVTVNVDTDVDSIYDKISEFVVNYNLMLDEMSGLLDEKVYRDYQPLTSEEKETMSEQEIELWEEKAKSGLLAKDETLTRTLSTLRSNLYEKVEGVEGSYSVMPQVGITTGNYKEGGKLVIDEDKLRDAIANDPEGVMELFFKVPDTTEMGADRTKESGLVQRVYDGMITGMKSIVGKSGPGEDANLYRDVQSNLLIDFVTTQGSISDIDRDLTSLGLSIYREESILAQKEQRYWARFTAMEKAISEMNSQSSWLTSQLGGQ